MTETLTALLQKVCCFFCFTFSCFQVILALNDIAAEEWMKFQLIQFVSFWCIFCCLFRIVSTSAGDCLERLVSEMTC